MPTDTRAAPVRARVEDRPRRAPAFGAAIRGGDDLALPAPEYSLRVNMPPARHFARQTPVVAARARSTCGREGPRSPVCVATIQERGRAPTGPTPLLLSKDRPQPKRATRRDPRDDAPPASPAQRAHRPTVHRPRCYGPACGPVASGNPTPSPRRPTRPP